MSDHHVMSTRVTVSELVERLNAIDGILTEYARSNMGAEEALERIEEVLRDV